MATVRDRRAGYAVPVAALIAVALVIRLAVVALSPHVQLSGDAVDYVNYARSIAAGHGFPATELARRGSPSAFRPPVYPLTLGAVFALIGDSVTDGRIVGAVLGALTVALIYELARVLGGRRTGLIAAAVSAVYLPFAVLSDALLSEVAFLPLMLIGLIAALRFRESNRVRWAIVAGVACGAATLTRTTGVLLFVIVAAGVLTGPGSVRRRLFCVGAVVLAGVVTIAPWTIRNTIAFHKVVPLTTESGPTLAGIYNRTALRPGRLHAIWAPPQQLPEFANLFHHGLEEPALSSRLQASALSFAWRHPAFTLTVFGDNAARLFAVGPGHNVLDEVSYEEIGIGSKLGRLTTWSGYVLDAAAAIAIVVLAARRQLARLRPRFLLLAPFLFWLAGLPVAGLLRYRMPVDLFCIILVGLALNEIAPDRVRERIGQP